jgi:prepilin-type N-terminal cleavage/methylation domain-containing protein
MSGRQQGFSLIEVIVSIVLLAVILTALAGMTYFTAQQAVAATNATAREAASLELVNRYATLPFASLQAAQGTSCDQVGATNDLYERCVTITLESSSRAAVRIVTTPLQRATTPAVVEFKRVAPPTGNPLCMTC